MSVAVHHGDCREIIPALGVTVDSVVCDPPYNLEAMAKRFGPGQKAATSPDHQRFAKGFMGMTWDTDVAFDPETWRIVGDAMRPRAFLVAFGGTRTYHRMTAAIEDAGFVIQDCIMYLFGSGFPKRRDMLKPAFEPIVLAYKPGGKRTMQIDECRVGTEQISIHGYPGGDAFMVSQKGKALKDRGEYRSACGRWPANVCHDGSDEVLSLFPQRKGGGDIHKRSAPKTSGIYGAFAGDDDRWSGYADSGSAARFFYCAKAGTEDRYGSRHPTVKPVELMKWLVALVTPPGGIVLDPFAGSGTTAAAAIATGRNAILVEREDQYVSDIRERLAFYEGEGRHSVVAKARRSQPRGDAPLFNYDAGADSAGSYTAAISEIGRRVREGEEPIPTGGYFAPLFPEGKP